MIRLTIPADNYDLQRTFEPSFVSSMYEKVHSRKWIKITGTFKGMTLEQNRSEVVVTFPSHVSEKALREIAIAESGLWHEAFEDQLSSVSRKFRNILEALAEAYPGVRIPVALHDLGRILISVLLSKRANYDMVRAWCKKIWSRYEDLEGLLKAPRAEIEEIGRSYQIFEAVESLKNLIKNHGDGDLQSFLRELSSKPPELARITLLSGKGIGPKIADSIILSAYKAPYVAPCDVHLEKFVRRTRIVEEFSMPVKALCQKYVCTRDASEKYGLPICPRRERCLRAILTSSLRDLAGWFQTLTYLHGRKFCKTANPNCRQCPLRVICRR